MPEQSNGSMAQQWLDVQTRLNAEGRCERAKTAQYMVRHFQRATAESRDYTDACKSAWRFLLPFNLPNSPDFMKPKAYGER